MGQIADICSSNDLKAVLTKNKQKDLISYLQSQIGLEFVKDNQKVLQTQISKQFKRLPFKKEYLPIFDQVIQEVEILKRSWVTQIKKSQPKLKSLQFLNNDQLERLKKIGKRMFDRQIAQYMQKIQEKIANSFQVKRFLVKTKLFENLEQKPYFQRTI